MKNLKTTLIAAGVAFLALSGLVLSQTISVPTVSAIHPTDLIQIVPFGAPQAQSNYVQPQLLTSQVGYYKGATAPSSNFVVTLAAGQVNAEVAPTGTVDSGYFVFNSSVGDGALNCVFSTQTITNLFLCTASTGVGNCTSSAINNRATTLAANAHLCYAFSSSNSQWDRVQ